MIDPPDLDELEQTGPAEELELEQQGLTQQQALEQAQLQQEALEQQLEEQRAREEALEVEAPSIEDSFDSSAQELSQELDAREQERIEELRAEDARKLEEILDEQQRNQDGILGNQEIAREGIAQEQEALQERLAEQLLGDQQARDEAVERDVSAIEEALQRDEDAVDHYYEQEGIKLQVEADEIEDQRRIVEGGQLAKDRASAERDLNDYEIGTGRDATAFRLESARQFDRDAAALHNHQAARAQNIEQTIDTAVEEKDLAKARVAVAGERLEFKHETAELEARGLAQQQAEERRQGLVREHETKEAWKIESDLRFKEDVNLRDVQNRASGEIQRRFVDDPDRMTELLQKQQATFD
jgi:hypothetical protein